MADVTEGHEVQTIECKKRKVRMFYDHDHNIVHVNILKENGRDVEDAYYMLFDNFELEVFRVKSQYEKMNNCKTDF